MRVKKRSLSIAAAATLLLATFGGAASTASASSGTGPDYVKQAIAKQLAHKAGGTVVNGDTIVYPGIAITYTPAGANTVTPAIWGCSYGYVCLYANGDHTNMRVNTDSLWCPAERTTRGDLALSDYGLAGNLRSADSENNYWVRAYYTSWGWNGVEWTMQPQGAVYNQTATDTNIVDICIYENDLWSG